MAKESSSLANPVLHEFKKKLAAQKVDFFLLPNSDEFFSEYLPESEKRIEYLTGFTGSNALVIFGQKKSHFFTDGRYVLQAENELDLDEFEIFNITTKPVFLWLEEQLTNGKKLAFDPKLVSLNFARSLQKIVEKNSAEMVLLGQNPVDAIWPNRPKPKNSAVFFCPEKISGADSLTKRSQILQGMKADMLIITKPESLCWLLNLRASDIEFTPLLLEYAILFENGEVELFVGEKRLSGLTDVELPKVKAIQAGCFDLRIAVLRKSVKKVQIDAISTNYWLYGLLEKSGFEIVLESDPIEKAKSCKNASEIFGAKQAHRFDGLALTKFLFWLSEIIEKGQEVDEILAAEKLLEFRQKQPGFLYPSFASISAFGSNGAIIHYHPTKKTNKKISGDGLYLIDSGGQYFGENFCGTTDVTRVIAIGQPSPEMIENFTRVLKGHIALAQAKFPIGTSGAQLDALARFYLWQKGRDYDHGTGHGVGSFLSVHEGPCAISRRSTGVLLPGMILSNEPGFYQDGKFGIRIENLMLVEEAREPGFLQFETLTFAPIDRKLIDFSLLTKSELAWLKDYHQKVFEELKNDLDEEEINWLKLCTK